MHIPDIAGGDPVAHMAVGRVEAAVEADLNRDPGFGGGRDAAVHVGQVQRQRLLHEGGLARGGHVDQQVDMGVGRAADGDGVHIVGLDNPGRAGRHPGAELPGHRRSRVVDDVVHGRQGRAGDPP